MGAVQCRCFLYFVNPLVRKYKNKVFPCGISTTRNPYKEIY